jgi:hypothetical protein
MQAQWRTDRSRPQFAQGFIDSPPFAQRITHKKREWKEYRNTDVNHQRFDKNHQSSDKGHRSFDRFSVCGVFMMGSWT